MTSPSMRPATPPADVNATTEVPIGGEPVKYETARFAGGQRAADRGGAVTNVRPIGLLKMVDDAGGDEKVLAVPTPRLTKSYEHVMNYTALRPITLEQMQHFFAHYETSSPGKCAKMQAGRCGRASSSFLRPRRA